MANPAVKEKLSSFVERTAVPLRLICSKKIVWESDYFRSKGNFCRILQSIGHTSRGCQRVHAEAVRESLRWGEAIISQCCYFVMQITAPVIAEGKLAGTLVASPLLLVKPSELQAEETALLYQDKINKRGLIEKGLSSIPILTDESLRQAALQLFELANGLSDPDLGHLVIIREAQTLQAKIADHICDLKNLDREFTPYSLSRLFYEREREIITKIRMGDRAGAKEILHQLLAITLIQYLENFELLKISILELLVILSRAAAEAGAKTEDILGMKYGFITELAGIKSQENLCLWLVKIFDKLMERIYDTRHNRNYHRLKRALDFIDGHYADPLSVAEIAREVYLSPSRLSHIIKEQMGITLGNYISKVRIEKAKALLRERDLPISQVALLTGFSDQSYFTKIFKKTEKCTPKAFQKSIF